MDIVDHGEQRLALDDVAIVTAAALPEAMFRSLATLTGNARQPFGSVFGQEADRFLGNRFFNGRANPGDVVLTTARINNEMDMLGHEDVGPDMKLPTETSGVDGIDQPLAHAVSLQEGESAVTTEGQFVSVAGFIVISAAHARDCNVEE